MDWRLYTALFYLQKGNLEAFYDLLLIKHEITTISENKDLQFLHENGWINFKDYKQVILLKKSDEILNKKNKNSTPKIEIDDEFLNNFRSGFPSNRYGEKSEIKTALMSFLNVHNEFSKEEILEAKEKYLTDQRAKDMVYVYKVSNFIHRELENYLRFIKSQKERNNDTISPNGTIMEW